MRGTHEITVTSRRIQFRLVARRNLTLLRGDSATGKTTLVQMVNDFIELGSDSGVTVKCDVPCVVLSGRNWKNDLAAIGESIIFIDEGNKFVASEEFAHAAKHSSNYYIIVSREALPMLPYSVDEIYGLRNNTRKRISKYPIAYRLYTSAYRIYADDIASDDKPELAIVEDSGSGCDFFSAICAESGVPCVSAGGKGNIFSVANKARANNILVIADGAAFGPEIETLLSLRARKRVRVFLPESFEWLLLDSGVTEDPSVRKLLDDPSPQIESSEFFSWEQFFTSELKRRTRGTYLAYEKSSLNPAYLRERERKMIEGRLPELGL